VSIPIFIPIKSSKGNYFALPYPLRMPSPLLNISSPAADVLGIENYWVSAVHAGKPESGSGVGVAGWCGVAWSAVV